MLCCAFLYVIYLFLWELAMTITIEEEKYYTFLDPMFNDAFSTLLPQAMTTPIYPCFPHMISFINMV